MSKPTSFELELIQKIIRASVKIEALKRRVHSDMCPVNDPHIATQCTCGTDKHDRVISEILDELKIKC